MLSYKNYYYYQQQASSSSRQNGIVSQETNDRNIVRPYSISTSSGSEDSPTRKKSDLASKKHAVAEKHRRQRINHHLNTLRDLFPNLTKRDKATVLTETVRQLRELKKKIHVVLQHGDDESWSLFLPGERDEATVTVCQGDGAGVCRTVKATVCCEDRPGLNRDLTAAVRSVNGKAVKAEISSVGGRTKAVVVVQWRGGDDDGVRDEEEDVGSLRRALVSVVENRVLGCSGLLGHGRKWASYAQELSYIKRPRIISEDVSDGPREFRPA